MSFLSALGGGLASIFGGERANRSEQHIAERNIEAQRAGQEFQFDADKEMQTRQMNFEERMSNTAVQRAAMDMQAAGFNRMLAAGMNASTPSVSGSSGVGGVSGSSAQIRDVLTPALATAYQRERLDKEIEQMDAGIKRTDAETEQSKSQTALNGILQGRAIAETKLTNNSAAKVATELPKLKNKSKVEETWLGKALPYLERPLEILGAPFRGLFGNK